MDTTPTEGRWGRIAREVLAACCLVASAAVVEVRLPLLPARMHTPINGGGDAAGMASRNQVWLLIVVAGWVYALLSLLNLLPAETVSLPRPLSPRERADLLQTFKAVAGWVKAGLMAGLLVWVCCIVR